MSFNPQTYLEKLYPHPRDKRITFDEPTHIYTIETIDESSGEKIYDSGFTSVTTWVHSHFNDFNSDKVITNMMSSSNWPNNKYYGMTRQQIKDAWEKNRDESARAGTLMHYDIECYYNNEDVSNDSIEYKYFKDFEEARTQPGGFGENLIPYRTEWMVFDKELRLSGSVDMIYENKDDGTLQIYDWKRSKEIKKINFWKSAKTECINHLPDGNYWHYSLQLNIYKAILERNYGKKVTDLYLVVLHPNNNTYKRIKVPILKQEIDDLFEHRKNELKK